MPSSKAQDRIVDISVFNEPLSIVPRIVSPSAVISKVEPDQAKYLSERSSITKKETIRRGDGRKVQAIPPADSAFSERDNLRLTQEQIAENILADKQESKTAKATDSKRLEKFRQRQPFGGSIRDLLFRGQSGDADYLPDVPDGDITLLNAKADRYAVFVRRVATQVFGAIRKLSWAELSFSEVQKINDFVTVQATLSRSGKLLKVQITNTSGSRRFDDILKEAAQAGSWDQNPPPGAEAPDGNIHFLFQSRTWSRPQPNGLSEQRWLLLGTGLQ